jgi:hypothetical protein
LYGALELNLTPVVVVVALTILCLDLCCIHRAVGQQSAFDLDGRSNADRPTLLFYFGCGRYMNGASADHPITDETSIGRQLLDGSLELESTIIVTFVAIICDRPGRAKYAKH